VCFREAVLQGGKTHKEWAAILKSMCKLPNGTTVTPKYIFFSHEKFSKQVTAHSPADEYSRELRALGLPPATRANPDRVGGASLMYNLFSNGDLVITDNCREIILGIPSLMRDPDNMDDVLKVDTKSDDAYDAFRYGIYGMLRARQKPEEMTIAEHAKHLDPLSAHFYKLKMDQELSKKTAVFLQKSIPVWQGKCGLE
jgi:hypothetical protein